MSLKESRAPGWRAVCAWFSALTVAIASVIALTASQTFAVGTVVPLGTADSFAVLGGEEITNTGPSVINGDLGVSPGTSISGFPPGLVNGSVHSADAVALQAKSDLVTAYNDAAGQAPDDSLPSELGGLTLQPGVYNASSAAGLTGTLTLDAEGDPDAVWIFQIGSALTTASDSSVSLINGASPCNVFWQIGSSATLGTNTEFVGSILALTSITANTGATIEGRALARNGSVSLDTNTINRPDCNGATTNGTTNGATTNGTTNGATTNGTSTTGATTTGGLLGGITGLTTGGGLIVGNTTSGGVTGANTTGASTVGGVTGATTGGGTTGGGSTTGATTGGGDHDKCKHKDKCDDHDKCKHHDKCDDHGKHQEEHDEHHDKHHEGRDEHHGADS